MADKEPPTIQACLRQLDADIVFLEKLAVELANQGPRLDSVAYDVRQRARQLREFMPKGYVNKTTPV